MSLLMGHAANYIGTGEVWVLPGPFGHSPAQRSEAEAVSTPAQEVRSPLAAPEPERRFRSTVPHYLAGRPAYAPALIARVAQLCGLSRACRVLDLGCGPGQLAIAFAPYAGSVLAVDPEPEMLRAARTAANGASNIEFREASSEDLGPAFGSFRMAVIGRAFHWMDRAETLRRLDRMIAPQGAVVLFGDDHPRVPDNRWRRDYRALIDAYAQGDPARERRRRAGYWQHETVLLASAFHELERVGIIERRRIETERLVDRALSMSSTSPARLGTRAGEFADRIREFAAGRAVGGLVTEVVESVALIARRHVPSAA